MDRRSNGGYKIKIEYYVFPKGACSERSRCVLQYNQAIEFLIQLSNTNNTFIQVSDSSAKSCHMFCASLRHEKASYFVCSMLMEHMQWLFVTKAVGGDKKLCVNKNASTEMSF